MTAKASIIVQAVVDAAEAAAVQRAMTHLSAALRSVSEQSPTLRCEVLSSFDAVANTAEETIVITSFLSEMDRYRDPWIAVEQRLRAKYESLVCHRNLIIFVCTVFRHVPWDQESNMVDARRVRIRRLNLLAAEFSRRLGIYVIDLDRALADIGAHSLQTDYRLAGNAATEAVAQSICLTLLSAGSLDWCVSIEDQIAAKAIIAARPVLTTEAVTPTVQLSDRSVLAMRAGRRIQRVSPTKPVAQEDYVSWLLNRLLRRRIGIAEAASLLARSIRRRGLSYHASLFFDGIGRLAKRISWRRR